MSELLEPNAMTLATADSSGQPDARTVLLKSFNRDGFVFYTNYQSRKSREIAENDRVCLLFYWGPLERQVRISEPFPVCPKPSRTNTSKAGLIGHQLGAWVSNQSAIIAGREVLGSESRRSRQALRTRSCSAAAALGRLSREAACFRVLARPAQPAARPARVCCLERELGCSPAGPLNGLSAAPQ